MKTYRLSFYAKKGIVAILMCAGLIALAGEPTEDANLLLCAALQLLTAATTWATALYLFRRWGLGKIEKRMESINKARQ